MKFITPKNHFHLSLLTALFTLTATAQSNYATPYFFTHLAGPTGGPGFTDGIGSVARFNVPAKLATDRAGNVYVLDPGNDAVRRITPAGAVTTLTAPNGSKIKFYSSSGVTMDSAGNIVAAGGDIIYRISPSGVVSVLAGASYPHYNNQTGKFSSITTGECVDATGTDARFFDPMGIAADNAGNVYVADTNNRTIRKISPAGEVTTLAGSPEQGSGTATITHFPPQINSADGTGSAAQFGAPGALALDGTGNLYVADTLNYTIRRITPGGVVTTLAGTAGIPGDSDGTGTAARFQALTGITADNAGDVYVTDNVTIRQITPEGVVTTIAGASGQTGVTDGTGTLARFNSPSDLAVDSTGNIYVADTGNYTIRKITPGGIVSTFAGMAGGPGKTDGTGTTARFDEPFGMALDQTGNLIVADHLNHMIRKITPGGVVTSLTPANQTGASVQVREPCGVGVDHTGNIFVVNAGSNSILKLAPDGVLSTFAGWSAESSSSGYYGSTDGPGTTARFAYPEGLTMDNADNIYVADTGNHTIRKITPAGVVSTLAGTAGQFGSADGNGSAARFNNPIGLAVDRTGTVYVADVVNSIIRKITPEGVVSTLAGATGQLGNADGTGPAAKFNHPIAVAVDNVGNVLVGDWENHLIRKITPAGVVSTLGGQALTPGNSDGVGSEAHFFNPFGLAIDGTGALYVSEQSNHAIRKGQLAGPPVISSQPQSVTVIPGGSANFSVTASGIPAPTYQWYFGNSSFSGATTNTLSFTNVLSADAGDYTVVITNSLGSVTSNKATLTVSTTPTPAPTPAGGGGSIKTWFVLALFALGVAHRWVNHTQSVKNRP